MTVLVVIAKIVSLLLSIVSTAMFVRAICSFIPPVTETRFFTFLLVITEPVVMPARFLLYKLNIGQQLPIDLSFTIAYFLLIFIEMLLPAL